MSDGDERPKSTLGLITAAIISLVVLGAVTCFAFWSWDSLSRYQDEQAAQREQAAQAYAEDANNGERRLCVRVAARRAEACVVEPEASEGERETAKSDLQAQQDMAQWGYGVLLASVGTFVLTLVGVGLLGWTLLATQQTLREAEAATEVAREIGQAQVRAYLAIENVSVGWNEGENGLRVHFSVSNAGNSPAQGFNYCCLIHVQRAGVVYDPADLYVRENATQFPVITKGLTSIATRGHTPFHHLDGSFVPNEREIDFLRGEGLVVHLSIATRFDDVFGHIVTGIEHFIASPVRANHMASAASHGFNMHSAAVKHWEQQQPNNPKQ